MSNSAASLTKVGEELPSGPPPPAHFTSITQNVTLADAYRTEFLPSFDRPTSISGDGLLFDRQAGLVVLPSGAVPGFRYQIASAVPRFDQAEFERAPNGNDPLVSADAQLPTDTPPPDEITNYASQPEFSKDTPFDSLKALEDDLKSNHFGYDIKSTPGHSYAVLQRFLAVPGGDGSPGTSRVGDAEQFAAAFASSPG